MSAPVTRTAHLTLRLVTDDDLPDLMRGLSDWRIARNISAIPFPYREADARAYFPNMQRRALEGTGYCWTISDGEFCGIVAVDFEASQGDLGYWLLPGSWGKGYATEAAGFAIDFAFGRAPCVKLTAGHAADNPASGNVLTKLGFVEIERGERYYVSRQMMVARIRLELTRERWQALRS